MCWQCDHPGATRLDFLAHMRDLVARYGWTVQGVERDGVHPPWAYTVGLTEAGFPELVATGLTLVRATRLLNDAACHLLHQDCCGMRPGDRIAFDVGGPLIEVVKVSEPAAHLLTAVEFYGAGIRALQLVHADYRGHWPWESGYRGGGGGQPVLGVRASRPVSAA
jgi:hypothetical protein